MPKTSSKNSSAEKIYNHPDRDLIIKKLCDDEPLADIAEWLEATYCEVNDRGLALPIRILADFQKNYLDFYTLMRTDLAAVKESKLTTTANTDALITKEIQGSSAYKTALERYANKELNIKEIVQRLCAAVEMRLEQVFNEIQIDPTNFKFDRIII